MILPLALQLSDCYLLSRIPEWSFHHSVQKYPLLWSWLDPIIRNEYQITSCPHDWRISIHPIPSHSPQPQTDVYDSKEKESPIPLPLNSEVVATLPSQSGPVNSVVWDSNLSSLMYPSCCVTIAAISCNPHLLPRAQRDVIGGIYPNYEYHPKSNFTLPCLSLNVLPRNSTS